jgi:hypothetical protein
LIGKYVQGEVAPFIDDAKKISDTFAVNLDYLVRQVINAYFDKKNLKSLQDIEKFDINTKEKI